jgi:hypothetical protein
VIEAGNQAPFITNTVTSFTIIEEQQLYFHIFANDPDSSGKPDMWVTNLPSGATFQVHDSLYRGTFDWTTDYYDSGTYQLIFYVRDSLDAALYDSTIFTIKVNNVNAPPQSTMPGYYSVTLNEGDTVVYRFSGVDLYDSIIPTIKFSFDPEPNMTLITYDSGLFVIGVFTFTPDFSQGGGIAPKYITYEVSWAIVDGADTLVATGTPIIQFHVVDVPQPPVITVISDTTIMEGSTLIFTAMATDFDGNLPLLWHDTVSFPPNATYARINVNLGRVTFRPDYTQAGTYNLRFVSSDYVFTVMDTVIVTVLEAGNQLPYFTTTFADTQVAIIDQQLSNRLAATDPEHEAIIITSSPLPTYATFVDSGNGAALFQFTPRFSQLGVVYQMIYVARDPLGGADTLITNYRVVEFMRGDANSDARLDVSDIMYLVNYLYKDGREPAIFDASDVNFDQALDIRDATYLIGYFYKQGPPPPNK